MFEDFRLKVFVSVAQEGSFTKAAKALGVTQPAASQHVSELEKAAGVRLFDRQRTRMTLTEAGGVFLKYAEKVLGSYSDMSLMFSKFPVSTVRIAASEEIYTYIIDLVLKDFRAVHPEIIFEKAFIEDADLTLSLLPSSEKRLGLLVTPSEAFSDTRLYHVLEPFLT